MNLLYFPRHLSCILQPLDAATVDKIEDNVQRLLEKHTPSSGISKDTIQDALNTAMKDVCMPKTIRKAFKSSGLYPYDPLAVYEPRDSNDASVNDSSSVNGTEPTKYSLRRSAVKREMDDSDSDCEEYEPESRRPKPNRSKRNVPRRPVEDTESEDDFESEYDSESDDDDIAYCDDSGDDDWS